MQNIPGGDKSIVKSLFVSRFGRDGCMAELDYSQLEVVTKAAISADLRLKQDLLDGVCFHCVNLALAEHMDPWHVQKLAKGIDADSPQRLKDLFPGEYCKADPVWKLKRKKIKPFTFQEKYGGGPALMAESTGLSVDEIKGIIEAKKLRYPMEAKFDEHVFNTANSNIQPSPFRTPEGHPAGIGYFQCETGTIYGFIEQAAPKWKQDRDGVLTGIKPTTTKNYPSQGLGGFIMEDAIGVVARWLLGRPDLWDKCKMVNTVHDCQWLDMHNDVVQEVVPIVKAIMQDVDARFVLMFGDLGWNLPYPADAEVGPDMLDLHHFKETA